MNKDIKELKKTKVSYLPDKFRGMSIAVSVSLRKREDQVNQLNCPREINARNVYFLTSESFCLQYKASAKKRKENISKIKNFFLPRRSHLETHKVNRSLLKLLKVIGKLAKHSEAHEKFSNSFKHAEDTRARYKLP